jgi:polyribonucleotide nucleotidyltransferase
VAGTADAVLMVESEADRLAESVMLGAVVYGHEQMQVAIRAIRELAAEAGKPAWSWVAPASDPELSAAVAAQAEAELAKAYTITEKQARYGRIAEVKLAVIEALSGGDTPKFDAKKVGDELGRLEYDIVRHKILAGERRIDGRDTRTVRPITVETGVLSRTHARHRPRRADHRCAVRRAERAVHAALQLPAVLRERSEHAARAEAPRNRPRQPRASRHQRRDAGYEHLSVRDPRGVGNPRV